MHSRSSSALNVPQLFPACGASGLSAEAGSCRGEIPQMKGKPKTRRFPAFQAPRTCRSFASKAAEPPAQFSESCPVTTCNPEPVMHRSRRDVRPSLCSKPTTRSSHIARRSCSPGPPPSPALSPKVESSNAVDIGEDLQSPTLAGSPFIDCHDPSSIIPALSHFWDKADDALHRGRSYV